MHLSVARAASFLVSLLVLVREILVGSSPALGASEDQGQHQNDQGHPEIQPSNHHHDHHCRGRREVWAWAGANNLIEQQVAQLRNDTWSSILDGIQLGCGVHVTDEGRLTFNQTDWDKYCVSIFKAAKDQNLKVEIWIGRVPSSKDPTQLIEDAIALQQQLGIDGFSFDDERDCAPRGTVDEFREWIHFLDRFTKALNQHNMTVSAAVQAMFGIQPSQSSDTGACDYKPSAYPFQSDVADLIQNSVLNKWLVMDTYYFTTGRFMGALDWYVENFPLSSLGISVQNRSFFSEDELVARFHALHHSSVRHINIFMMPVDDKFLPYLARWKTHCRHCGVQSVLGCFDMSIECNYSNDVGPLSTLLSTTDSSVLIQH